MAFENDVANVLVAILQVNLGQIVVAGAAILGFSWVVEKIRHQSVKK